MKSIELLAIGIRLVGLYAFMVGIKTAVFMSQTLPATIANWGEDFPVYLKTLIIAEVAIIFLAGFLLLKFPLSVARWLMPSSTESGPVLDGSAKDIQSAMFCVVGVYILSWAIPDLVNNVLFLYTEEKYTGRIAGSQYLNLIIVTVIEIVIGLYLSVQAHGLSNFLWRLRGHKE